jgi:hypothetical protein
LAPVITTFGSLLTKILALLQILDEKFDVQEIVLAQFAFQVVDHPLGAASEQVAELGLGVVAGAVMFVVTTSSILKHVCYVSQCFYLH